MPRIVASIENNKDPFLQGEVMEWNVSISNVGSASVGHLVLKTNLPWLCLVEESSDKGHECNAISSCIGPSGTVMEISMKNALQSGETIKVPFKVRASGGGRQFFHLLLRYTTMKAQQERAQIRYLKKSLQYTVYPSLSLSFSSKPSFSDGRKFIISLEVCYNFLIIFVQKKFMDSNQNIFHELGD